MDKVFSLYVRRKYSNQEGYTTCYTCDRKLPWKEADCGHFVSRQHLATRFDEDNVRVQCKGCNVFGGGRVAVFATRLEKEYPGIVNELYRKSQEITKNYPYEEKIKYYQEKIKELNQ